MRLRFKPGDLALIVRGNQAGYVCEIICIGVGVWPGHDYGVAVNGWPSPHVTGYWSYKDNYLMPLRGDPDQFSEEWKENYLEDTCKT